MILQTTEKQSTLTQTGKKEVTILYPGSFKPITGAHIDLIKRYSSHPDVDRIVMFMSPSKREGIDTDIAFDLIQNVLKEYPVDFVLDKKSYSPILAVYRWIESQDREPGYYALAASTKNNDYVRVQEFTNNYSLHRFGKNLPSGVNIIELLLDVEPLTYENGQPISATCVRDSLLNCDFDNFKTSYPNVDNKKVKLIWETFKQK